MPLPGHDTATELVRVLGYPKVKLTLEEQRDLLADCLPWAKAVRPPARLPQAPACHDPHDVPFLQLAFAG